MKKKQSFFELLSFLGRFFVKKNACSACVFLQPINSNLVTRNSQFYTIWRS
ncbi:AgrD family cyclic lactone autoinducer peptide [Acinetobacter bereziniae]|uniref:AgrD family cyclic lactone autoinducer peptide n=1 Tax=Acinetobacter bereziniae TaxID=106648 RepID=UPI0013003A69